MTVKYLSGDFDVSCFPKDFGFSESAKGGHGIGHKAGDDGTYVGKRKAQHKAHGGPVDEEKPGSLEDIPGEGEDYKEHQREPPEGHRRGGAIKRASGGAIDLETVPGRPGNDPVGKGSPTGGPLQDATVSMPLGTAAKTIAASVELGRQLAEHGAPAGRPVPAPTQDRIPAMKKGGHLTASERHALPSKDFALPGGRYPIEDASHARAALSRVSANGSSEEKATVRRAVHRKYPGIGQQ